MKNEKLELIMERSKEVESEIEKLQTKVDIYLEEWEKLIKEWSDILDEVKQENKSI